MKNRKQRAIGFVLVKDNNVFKKDLFHTLWTSLVISQKGLYSIEKG